jgi:hydrogenase nickel incorporation protein HypB
MCDSCGCSDPVTPDHDHDHEHEHGQQHSHGPHALTPAHSKIQLNVNVLKANNSFAEENRAVFKKSGMYAVNIIGSPGSGKTTIVEALARHFGKSMAVIEGDIQTRRDAERVIRAGSRAWQIETNGSCHLDAHSVGHALDHLDPSGCKLLVIENVGNLVCPASYDLGEDEKIAVLSIPEGDDKVLKYPSLFHRAGVLLINKVDLSPYVDFDISKAVNECRSLNRSFTSFEISAKTGQGMDTLYAYLAEKAGISRA